MSECSRRGMDKSAGRGRPPPPFGYRSNPLSPPGVSSLAFCHRPRALRAMLREALFASLLLLRQPPFSLFPPYDAPYSLLASGGLARYPRRLPTRSRSGARNGRRGVDPSLGRMRPPIAARVSTPPPSVGVFTPPRRAMERLGPPLRIVERVITGYLSRLLGRSCLLSSVGRYYCGVRGRQNNNKTALFAN